MRNEVKNYIPDNLIDALQKFDDDYLADVLRPWDCYEQKWTKDSPMLFRFEHNDLLIWTSSDKLECIISNVDTRYFIHEALISANNIDVRDLCLCWRVDLSLSKIVGLQGKEIDFLAILS